MVDWQATVSEDPEQLRAKLTAVCRNTNGGIMFGGRGRIVPAMTPVILRLLVASLLLLWLSGGLGFCQNPNKRLTNKDIIDMTGLGLSDDVIIAKVRSVSGADGLAFDTSVDGLKALKAANVSDAVIKVMLNPAPPQAPVVVAAAAITNDPNFPPPEVGVYWKDAQTFVLIQGMTLSKVKAGGRAGAFFTNGMRSEHWDATIEGPTSRNHVKDRRPVFYLYVPDGDTSADYVLIRLEKKGDRREFEVGSFGGVTGGKAGVKNEKEVPFHAEHVGIRMYRVTLDADLKAGEYGFFLGTGMQSNMSGGNMGSARSGGSAGGRIYDFSISQ
jgi:hypothetical protein